MAYVLCYRYYYKREILERVDGRRLVYKFGRNARGWRESEKWQFDNLCFIWCLQMQCFILVAVLIKRKIFEMFTHLLILVCLLHCFYPFLFVSLLWHCTDLFSILCLIKTHFLIISTCQHWNLTSTCYENTVLKRPISKLTQNTKPWPDECCFFLLFLFVCFCQNHIAYIQQEHMFIKHSSTSSKDMYV